MRKFTVEIKPLTPIWTGDADKKVTTLRETGIIGSLRWWYEALVRGYGGSACDPTEKNKNSKCELKEKKFKELLKSEKSIKKALDKSGICSACQLFGCTGWSRRFRLEVDYKEEKIPLFFVSSFKSNRKWLVDNITKEQNEILWSKDPIKLNFIHMSNGKDSEIEDIIKALILIISRYGGLGAKLQYGFGQFDTDIDKMTVNNGVHLIKNNINKEKGKNPTLISFSNFFMMKFRISDNNPILKDYMSNKEFLVRKLPERWGWDFIPCAFDIKYKGRINNIEFGLRNYFKQRYGDKIVKNVFGYSNLKSNDNKGSSIFVSHPYKESANGWYYLKIYGFLDEKFAQKFKKEIKSNLEEKFKADIEEEVSGKELLEGLLNGVY